MAKNPKGITKKAQEVINDATGEVKKIMGSDNLGVTTTQDKKQVYIDTPYGGYGDGAVSDLAKPFGFATPTTYNGSLPTSLFNRAAVYNYSGYYGDPNDSNRWNNFTDYQQKAYTNINGSDYAHGKLTEQTIVAWYSQFHKDIAYRPNDFIYNKWYGKIPPNYLITLRRFSMPCNDNIFNRMVDDLENNNQRIKEPKYVISTAVSYMGEESGNKLEDILKMSYKLNWKEQKSELQELSTHEQTQGNGFWDRSKTASLFAQTINGMSSGQRFSQSLTAGDGSDRFKTKYQDFVRGPVNVIDTMMTRDRGLIFENEYTLNFDYEMKSIYMINPKLALLDVISNMLTMGYNQGDFWGGGVRYYGSTQFNKVGKDLYGDLSKLRAGDFKGYAYSVGEAFGKKFGIKFDGQGGKKGSSAFFSALDNLDMQSVLKMIQDLLKNGVGNLLGNFLNDFAGGLSQPASDIPKALLSGEDTGNWHVTIGNPLNPIAVMGNMILDKTEMSFGNGLGYDDFPTQVSFKCSLKHGRGRDIGDIENMFNIGKGRIYDANFASAQKYSSEVFDGDAVKTYGSVNAGKNKFAKSQAEKMKNVTFNNADINELSENDLKFIRASIYTQYE